MEYFDLERANKITDIVYLFLVQKMSTSLIKSDTKRLLKKHGIQMRMDKGGVSFKDIDEERLKSFLSELISISAATLGVSEEFLRDNIRREFLRYELADLSDYFSEIFDDIEDTELNEKIEGLEFGHAYLYLEDKKSSDGLTLFSKLVSKGLPGLCISRKKPDKIKDRCRLKDTQFHQLKRHLSTFFW